MFYNNIYLYISNHTLRRKHNPSAGACGCTSSGGKISIFFVFMKCYYFAYNVEIREKKGYQYKKIYKNVLTFYLKVQLKLKSSILFLPDRRN